MQHHAPLARGHTVAKCLPCHRMSRPACDRSGTLSWPRSSRVCCSRPSPLRSLILRHPSTSHSFHRSHSIASSRSRRPGTRTARALKWSKHACTRSRRSTVEAFPPACSWLSWLSQARPSAGPPRPAAELIRSALVPKAPHAYFRGPVPARPARRLPPADPMRCTPSASPP